jgi:hypothetical protein
MVIEGKMTKIRALLVGLLAAVLTISSLSSASASTSGSSDGFDYTFDGTNVTIDGCTNACSGDLVIPDFLTEVSDWGVSEIAAEAFKDNDSITSVRLPIFLRSIGESAFESNFSLASIAIPFNVQSIGARAFYDTRALTSVTFEDECQLESIGNQAFQSAAFSSITLPATVETIGEHIFTSAQSLTSINLVAGNTHFQIQNDALLSSDGTRYIAYPARLGSPVIPDTVTYIESGAFYGNGNIATITFPESIQEIGAAAFAGNVSLYEINFYGDVPIGGVDALNSFAYFGGTLRYYTHKSGWADVEQITYLTEPTNPDAVGLTLERIPTNRYVGGAEFSGKFKVGKTVSLFRGNWEFISMTTYKFKWYACKRKATNQLESVKVPKNCKAVSKNVSSIYKLKKNAKKKYLAVVMSAISNFGTVKVLVGSSKKVR